MNEKNGGGAIGGMNHGWALDGEPEVESKYTDRFRDLLSELARQVGGTVHEKDLKAYQYLVHGVTWIMQEGFKRHEELKRDEG